MHVNMSYSDKIFYSTKNYSLFYWRSKGKDLKISHKMCIKKMENIILILLALTVTTRKFKTIILKIIFF